MQPVMNARPALPPVDPFLEWILTENERLAERRTEFADTMLKILRTEPRRFIGIPSEGLKEEQLRGEEIPTVVRWPFDRH